MLFLFLERTGLVEINLPTSFVSDQILTCVPSALTFDPGAQTEKVIGQELWKVRMTQVELTDQPGDTVSVDLGKHEGAVILQLHPSFADGFDGGWTAAVNACRTAERQQASEAGDSCNPQRTRGPKPTRFHSGSCQSAEEPVPPLIS